MKSFAGTVCELITIVIYGVAVIAGILYHSGYVSVWKSMNPDQEVRFDSTYFITWISFLCAAAVISAIHHALWSIIDNQLSLYSELKDQNNMMEEIREMLKTQMPVQQNANEILNGNNSQSNVSNGAQNAIKQWTCDKCGTVNTKSQCTNCGQLQQ